MVIYSALPFFIILCQIQLFILISNAQQQQPELWWYRCPNTTTYNQNSTYQANLRRILSDLSSNNSTNDLFSNSTAGNNAPDIVYGLFLCRGDVTSDVCRECVTSATSQIVKRCPKEKESVIWYDNCMLRYNNVSFFGTMDTYPRIYLTNMNNISDQDRLDHVLGGVMDGLINNASGFGNVGPIKGFSTGEGDYTSILKLYNLVQCTPDLSSLDCNKCLRDALSNRPEGKQGGRVLYASCSIRYEIYPFYNSIEASPAPPPSSTPPPLPQPPPVSDDIGSEGNGGLSAAIIVAIVVPLVVSMVLFTVTFCLLRRKAKKQQSNVIEAPEADDGNDISTEEYLKYDLSNVKAATNDFSANNKIGEGGFGEVFKGTLNGKQIAVKRLSKSSGQGGQEFKNEVLVVAKLQHRNLVRLLGYCLDEGEKILIYEYVPNESLDYILFDQERQQSLNWSIRYKIIGGVAKGLLYLHEDSRLRIIHRDLKASNILLDSDMNAKISDFGTARIVGADESQLNTSRVAGTFGYMAPEYVLHALFSIKSDVFSYGVLVLEIISGKKKNSFHQSGSSDDLLSYAWKLWRDGRPLDLVSPTLRENFARNEVIRCILIGLLCVQEDPEDRPTTASVVLMLSSYSVTLPLPKQPAFFISSRPMTMPRPPNSDESSSKSLQLSVNEVSVTEELSPR